MKKLEIFGDSILKGVMCSDNGSHYKLYKSKLAERLEYSSYEIKKNCNMGATIEDGNRRLRKRAEHEDMSGCTILIEFGGNDCAYDWHAVSADPLSTHSPKVEIQEFIKKYEDAISFARTLNAEPILTTLVPIDADRYMNFISRGLSYDNIKSWLGDVSMLYRWHEQYNREVEKIADRCGCKLIDLRRPFLLSHRFYYLIGDDGIHPTDEGHKLIEDILVSEICA